MALKLPVPCSPFSILHSALEQAPRRLTCAAKPPQLPVDIPSPLCQYRAMIGGIEYQFCLTRAALSTWGRAKTKFECGPGNPGPQFDIS